jgi:hypothetical protein
MHTVVALGLALTAVPALAQRIPAGCEPLLDATRKQIITPHHAWVTQGGRTTESISIGGATYILVHGTWKRSALGQKEALDQMQKNLRTATAYSCQHVGNESVGGVPAAVYTSHVENQGVKADARTWIATGTGLILHQEEDMGTDDGTGTTHMSIRWDYSSVHAPTGVGAP